MRDEEVFEHYAPFIREYIYRNNWESLREVQIEAAKVIFGTEDNLLLCAGTASGKTEAAFFPILSQLYDDPPNSVAVMYIAPLKSLINDQFGRLEELLDEADIPVYHWHGDVAASHKQKMIKNPAGILQITPESLESMLMRRANEIPRIFANLRYVIIDEIHIMPGVDRGNQIICQLERLSRLIGHNPRRIGLSATIGEPDKVAEWLSGGSGRDCSVVEIRNAKNRWKIAINHFFINTGLHPEIRHGGVLVTRKDNEYQYTNDGGVYGEDGGENAYGEMASDIDKEYEFVYDSVKDKRALVFSNSREETEYVTATLRQIAKARGDEDNIHIHHGNLSTSIREETEAVMKDEDKSAVACATVTMELGLDIGRLERVVQMDSPNTVANFLQRLGRSGRRGQPPEMIMVFREEEPLPNASVGNLIPWDLLRAIAIIQLYIEEKWIEPPMPKKLPFSLLFHQTMCVVASGGSVAPPVLAERMLGMSAFSQVSAEQYRDFLVHLVNTGQLQLTDERELIIGLKGEKIINSFRFLAVFKDSEDFTVREGGSEIGTITYPLPVGERFALAGRVWEITEIDTSRKLIFVKSVEGKMKIEWPGSYGEIHTKIVERIRGVLAEEIVYPYLMPNAAKRLLEARDVARNTHMLETPMVPLGGNSYCFFPWLGTRSFRTLRRFIKAKCSPLFRIKDLEFNGCYFMQFKMEKGSDYDFIKYIHDYVSGSGVQKHTLVGSNESFLQEKYDEFVRPKLLTEAYIADRLREDEIEKRVREYLEMY